MTERDTNVLLRYLLRDAAAQAERSRRVFERDERILITDKADVVAVVEKLLQEPNVRFEDDEVIWSALQAYRETDADFADALSMHKALKTAALDDELHAVYTFDTTALQLPYTAEP